MERPLVLTLALCFLLSGCASRRYETDKGDPNYQTGAMFPSTQPPDQGYSGGEAAAGLVATGIALAANRDYYKSTGITGKCLCRDAAGENLALPCGAVVVVLSDTAGKVIARSPVSGAEFAFRVLPKESYRLDVESDRYRLEKRKPEREYQLGDDVILYLVRR